jgi:dihydroorotase
MQTHWTLELYAQAFEDADALDRLEDFASHFGPDFYDLPRNTDKITLEKQDWQVPDSYPLSGSSLVPLFAGKTLHWRVKQKLLARSKTL